MAPELDVAPAPARTETTALAVLVAVSVSHLLNDTMQSLLPAIYPLLKASFALTFAQVGLMTLALMLTASRAPAARRPLHRSSSDAAMRSPSA